MAAQRRSFSDMLRSNAADAGRWIQRARDTLGDAIGRIRRGPEQQDRQRFLRYYNSQAGRLATSMGRSDATQKVREITRGRPGELRPEKLQLRDKKEMRFIKLSPNALQTTHIGGMYVYVYKAKWAKELPYYDAFPLVFLIRNTAMIRTKQGGYTESSAHFLGLNLHYVSPRQRAFLMDALNDRLMRNGFDELHPDYNPRLYARLSYQVLQAAARHRLFEPCVKMYRKDHVMGGSMVRIPGANWAEIMFLPTARWRINNNNQRFRDRPKNQSGIWRESARR